jgi:hypothetical protein
MNFPHHPDQNFERASICWRTTSIGSFCPGFPWRHGMPRVCWASMLRIGRITRFASAMDHPSTDRAHCAGNETRRHAADTDCMSRRITPISCGFKPLTP